ncbi:hypothetical protein L873DRAFT_1571471, partial [Choiromyces venosus 120613-1]
DVELDASHFRARTLVFFTALNCHEGVVRLPLSRPDINPNSLDNSGETPLLYCTRGQVAVVNMLLGRKDIILNRPGTAGFSAIYLAILYGHE